MDCNEHLILKLTNLAKNIEKIVDTAGEKLVDNIRDEAKKSFGNSKYPYEFQNDFQKPETVQYSSTHSGIRTVKRYCNKTKRCNGFEIYWRRW